MPSAPADTLTVTGSRKRKKPEPATDVQLPAEQSQQLESKRAFDRLLDHLDRPADLLPSGWTLQDQARQVRAFSQPGQPACLSYAQVALLPPGVPINILGQDAVLARQDNRSDGSLELTVHTAGPAPQLYRWAASATTLTSGQNRHACTIVVSQQNIQGLQIRPRQGS